MNVQTPNLPDLTGGTSLAPLPEEGTALRPASRTWLLARPALLVLSLVAFAWRVHGLTGQSLWRDEVDAIYFATRHLPETLRMFVLPGQNGPLFFLALRPWFSLVGTSEFALRYPSALAGMLSVPLLYQAARRLLPSRPGGWRGGILPLLAGLFLAVNPYQLWYSQEGKMYAVIVALVLLATWLWWKGITRGGWRPWLAYWATLTLALYTHLLMILIFPLHGLWFLLAWPQAKRHWRGYGAALAGLTLPYLPMVWWQWDLLLAKEQRTGFQFTPLADMLETLLYNHSRGFMPPGPVVWMAPVFFLAAAGLLLGMEEVGEGDPADEALLAPWRRMALLWTWLLVPVLTIYGLSLRQPIFTDRYVIWIGPALMLLMALGVAAVYHSGGKVGRWIAVGLVVYVVGFWLYAGWQQKTLPTKYNLRDGVQFIAQHRQPDALLILQIPHMEYAYRYYTSDFGPRPFHDSEARLAPWAPGLWTNTNLPDEQARQAVAQQMAGLTAGFRDVWVLRSEVEMWDQRHLMDEWLAQNGVLVDQADFHGVQVRHYRLGVPEGAGG